MKKLPILILVLSLAANAALIFVVMKHSSAESHSESKESSAKSKTVSERSPSSTVSSPLTEEQMRGLALTADLLTTTDLPTLVTRLRSAGFSPHIIRGIIAAQISRDFGARRKAAVAHQQAVPYWRSSQTFPNDPKAGSVVSGLIREQNKTLRNLLGSDALADDEWSQLIRERQFGYLPEKKIEPFQDLIADYTDLRNRVHAEAKGTLLADDLARLEIIDHEQRADLASLLTTEELENYDLRNNPRAHQLRYQLNAFEPSEEEFRAIYKIWSDLDAKFPGALTGRLAPEQAAEFQAAQKVIAQQIQATLTPDRAAVYNQATNPIYQQISQLLTRLELPSSLGPKVMSLQQEFVTRSNSIQQDNNLTMAERNEKITALITEAKTTLTTTLGSRGYEAYRQGSGYWLNALSNGYNRGNNRVIFDVKTK